MRPGTKSCERFCTNLILKLRQRITHCNLVTIGATILFLHVLADFIIFRLAVIIAVRDSEDPFFYSTIIHRVTEIWIVICYSPTFIFGHFISSFCVHCRAFPQKIYWY